MDKLEMKTARISQENIEKIRGLFPNAVTEIIKDGKVELAVDFDVLKQELSDSLIEVGQERYQMTWPDKKKSVVLANSAISATLRPCRDESVDFDTTQNLYIEGDNLDVLKLLRETYLGKVKMIYIDPPYNTGNDFVYDDDFAQSADDYKGNSGQYDEQGNRLFQNTESNGRFHTDWLNMIYPRLKIARDLLSDDGVIFISIDDNEQANLKKICDEIFGAINYINNFAWIVNITGRQISGKGAAKTWENILVYAKDFNKVSGFFIDIKVAKSKMPDVYKGFKKDIREDSIGQFSIGDTLYNHNRMFNEETRPNLVFSIFYNPETQEIITGDIGENIEGFVEIKPHFNGDGVHKYHAWRWSKDKIKNENYNLIVLPTSSGGYEIYTKIRDFDKTLLKDIITNISNGDSEVQKIFEGKKYFNYPKSVDLLGILLGAVQNQDSIILDFFSGSATTAHAVMQLNAEDGGNRKFIMVQLPEKCDEKSEAYKAGYKNICEIGKERIRRAGKKILDEQKDKTDLINKPAPLDIGFRVLKLDSSNMQDVFYNPAAMTQDLLATTIDNVKPDRTPMDLLFQIMLELGVQLSAKIEEKEICGKKYYVVNENEIIACFDDNLNNDVITEIAKQQPLYAVFKDKSFATDSVGINNEQLFKTYSPSTEVKVI